MRARKNPIRRVSRGGSYYDEYASRLRVTLRVRGIMPVFRNDRKGFRFVIRGKK